MAESMCYHVYRRGVQTERTGGTQREKQGGRAYDLCAKTGEATDATKPQRRERKLATARSACVTCSHSHTFHPPRELHACAIRMQPMCMHQPSPHADMLMPSTMLLIANSSSHPLNKRNAKLILSCAHPLNKSIFKLIL